MAKFRWNGKFKLSLTLYLLIYILFSIYSLPATVGKSIQETGYVGIEKLRTTPLESTFKHDELDRLLLNKTLSQHLLRGHCQDFRPQGTLSRVHFPAVRKCSGSVEHGDPVRSRTGENPTVVERAMLTGINFREAMVLEGTYFQEDKQKSFVAPPSLISKSYHGDPKLSRSITSVFTSFLSLFSLDWRFYEHILSSIKSLSHTVSTALTHFQLIDSQSQSLRRSLASRSLLLSPSRLVTTFAPAAGPVAAASSSKSSLSSVVIAVIVTACVTLAVAAVVFCVYRKRKIRKSSVGDKPLLFPSPSASPVQKSWGYGSDSGSLGGTLPVAPIYKLNGAAYTPTERRMNIKNDDDVGQAGKRSKPFATMYDFDKIQPVKKNVSHKVPPVEGLQMAGRNSTRPHLNKEHYEEDIDQSYVASGNRPARYADIKGSDAEYHPEDFPEADVENAVSSFSLAPASPSPYTGKKLQFSSAVLPREDATSNKSQRNQFKGAQTLSSFVMNPSPPPPLPLPLTVPSPFEETESKKAKKSHQARKPTHNTRYLKSEETVDPYPVGWHRTSLPNKPEVPVKSSYISAPSPAPRPLPAPPTAVGLPLEPAEPADVVFPNLQDYMAQFASNANDDDSSGESGGWSSPESPSSPKPKVKFRIAPPKPLPNLAAGKALGLSAFTSQGRDKPQPFGYTNPFGTVEDTTDSTVASGPRTLTSALPATGNDYLGQNSTNPFGSAHSNTNPFGEVPLSPARSSASAVSSNTFTPSSSSLPLGPAVPSSSSRLQGPAPTAPPPPPPAPEGASTSPPPLPALLEASSSSSSSSSSAAPPPPPTPYPARAPRPHGGAVPPPPPPPPPPPLKAPAPPPLPPPPGGKGPPPPPPCPSGKGPPPPPPPPGGKGPPPPPPPPDGKGPTPPPPPGGKGPPPPPPPMGKGNKPPPPPPGLRPLNISRTSSFEERLQRTAQAKNSSPPKPQSKLKPLHWDKVKAAPDQSMVWDNLSKSFELDPDVLEALFGIQQATSKKDTARKPAVSDAPAVVAILDSRKAHNFSIQLRALGLTRREVCAALLEGEGLSPEILETLVKVAPSDDEKRKFQKFDGNLLSLGPADRFFHAILEVPSAWSRFNAMLFQAQYKEELSHVQESLATLEMACKELKGSRTFRKLLEAVLKTGNRLNMGTLRGDAQAFKLDTLLKLADVKGTDGKTTLLHFVIQEIIKSESVRVARAAGRDPNGVPSTPNTPGSPNLPIFAAGLEAAMESGHSQKPTGEESKKMGMEMVLGLPSELSNVRKAGALDITALKQSVQKLTSGLSGIRVQVRDGKYTQQEPGMRGTERIIDLSEDSFQKAMESFVLEAEKAIGSVQGELDDVLGAVKKVSIYFYGGDAAKNDSEPFKVFVVVKQFLGMLEQACKDVVKANAQLAKPSSGQPSPRSQTRGF